MRLEDADFVDFDSPMVAMLATMDLDWARPTLSVVLGSRLGGAGGCIECCIVLAFFSCAD